MKSGKQVVKKVTKYDGNNVRIPTNSYSKLRKFIDDNGWRIGWFFETAALEKMETELQKQNKK